MKRTRTTSPSLTVLPVDHLAPATGAGQPEPMPWRVISPDILRVVLIETRLPVIDIFDRPPPLPW